MAGQDETTRESEQHTNEPGNPTPNTPEPNERERERTLDLDEGYDDGPRISER